MERLKKVMNSIVHQDQTSGVVGRTIFSHLHLVSDTLDLIDKTNEPAILLTLDQEKAFDRVDHEFMLRVLRKFGFGPSFRKSKSSMRMRSRIFKLMVLFPTLSTFIEGFDRAVLSLHYYMSSFQKFY